jgi:hypothetical protein
MNERWAVISSDYINAWSLIDSLRRLEWPTRIVCLKPRDGRPALTAFHAAGVDIWEEDIETPADFLSLLSDRIPRDDAKALLFTEERFLEITQSQWEHPWLKTARRFPPPGCLIDTILDRFAFYDFITRNGLGATPRTIAGASDPIAEFQAPFILRFRRSWSGTKKTPRVQLIRGCAQLEEALTRHQSTGFRPNDWCFQECLSLAPRNNVSVCGWHDADDPKYVATQKVLQHPPHNGNGDVCKVIPLPPELRESTRRLLDALRFVGPFELEFVRDLASGQLKIIELNPRFWMQHALAGAATGDAVVRRYLGVDSAGVSPGVAPSYWLNSIYVPNRLLRLDLRPLPYLALRRHLTVPPWHVALRFALRQAPSLVKRAMRGE